MTKQIPIDDWDRLHQAVLQGASDLTERIRSIAKRISDVARNEDLTPAKEWPIEETASCQSFSFNSAMSMLGALETRGGSDTFVKWWMLAGGLFLIALLAYPKIAPWIQRLKFRSHRTLTPKNLKRNFESAAAFNLKTEDYQNGKDYRLQAEQGSQANEIIVFGLMCDGSVVKTPSVEVLIEANTIVLKVIAKTVRPLGPTPDQIYAAILNVLWQSKAVPVWIRFQISSSVENAVRWVVSLEGSDLVSSDEKRREKEFRKRIDGGPRLTLDQRFSWKLDFKGKKNGFPTAREMLQKVDRLQGVEFLLRQHNLWVLFLHKPHSEPVISGLSNLFATANVWSPVPPEAAKLPSSRRASGGDELRASSSRRRRSLRVTDSPACCWEASFSPTDSAIEPNFFKQRA